MWSSSQCATGRHFSRVNASFVHQRYVSRDSRMNGKILVA